MSAEKGWAILGDNGLYFGWWMTRKDAIAGHVRGYLGTASWGGKPLTDEERALWEKLKSEGDRPVKVTIRWAAGK